MDAALRESRKWDGMSNNYEADVDFPLFPWIIYATQLHDFDNIMWQIHKVLILNSGHNIRLPIPMFVRYTANVVILTTAFNNSFFGAMLP